MLLETYLGQPVIFREDNKSYLLGKIVEINYTPTKIENKNLYHIVHFSTVKGTKIMISTTNLDSPSDEELKKLEEIEKNYQNEYKCPKEKMYGGLLAPKNK